MLLMQTSGFIYDLSKHELIGSEPCFIKTTKKELSNYNPQGKYKNNIII